ncbi:ATP-binding protein [Halalkalibacterium halodurans]|uniref:hybrid sensor histidine kinase/response regulator n=1 Tax=Halalkalibacterium halodurans TaxID=86665 RepID=UPI002E1A0C5F|nr:ATP-binding protein [Halalkalibacterium halodurans]
MSMRKTLSIVLLFVVIITSFRVIWYISLLPLHQPFAEQGVLDLSEFSLSDKDSVVLDGEWSFYPNAFATTEDQLIGQEEKTIKVPLGWNKVSPFAEGSEQVGTYQLRIRVQDAEERYALKVQRIFDSFLLYANGELVEERRAPTITESVARSSLTPSIVRVTPDENGWIHLMIAVSSSENIYDGGVLKSIRFGTEVAMNREHWSTSAAQLMVAAIMFIHGIYACILFFIRPKKIELLYFMVAVLLSAFSVLVSDERLLLQWVPLNYEWFIKLAYLSYTGLSLFFLLFVRYLFSNYKRNQSVRWISGFCALYALFILIAPATTIREWTIMLLFVLAIPFTTIILLVVQVILKKERDSLFLLLAAISVASSILWSSFTGRVKSFEWGILSQIDYSFYPVDLTLAFLCFSTFWFIRFFRANDDKADLVTKLQKEHVKKDQFLANTSHELRNPLHGMINIAQGVVEQEGGRLAPESRQNLELLMTVGRRMSYLLNDLIDVTKMKQKKVTLTKQPTNLLAAVTTVVNVQRFMVEAKNLRIEVNIPHDFPLVYADETRLGQILFNLVHNAIKYTEEGTIVIEAKVKKKRAVIRVKDTGIGMDEETQKRIFHPYEQGAKEHYHENGGFGLGLSICRDLVSMHNGTLAVQSAPSKGSIFTFTLPLASSSEREEKQRDAGQEVVRFREHKIDEEVAASHLPTSAPVRTEGLERKPKILIVDDDAVNLHVLKNIICSEAYTIEAVTSCEEVLDRLDQGWDLILADVMMPSMSGYELTREIRNQFSISELPVLLLTARGQPEEVYTGFMSGANDYLVKPIDALELKVRIRAVIELKHSIQERLRMEAAWLQAQIQPHFLFNTLNTIASLSEIDTKRMAALLEKFGQFLRKSFDGQNIHSLVPITHELALTESYVYIEQERFGERLKVHWDKDEHVVCNLPPLSIQPLVENALKHGVLKKPEGGNVHIRIKKQEETVKIMITDDGVGMDKATLNNVLTRKPDQVSGIGMLNTDLRLKQLFGKGLFVESQPGKGTSISFYVPLNKLE